MSTRDFSFISFFLLPFSAKMPAMHWFKLPKKSVSFTTATFFHTFAFLRHFIRHICLGNKWNALLVLLQLLMLLLSLLSIYSTKRLHFRHRFPFAHFMRYEWKCFIIFLLLLPLSEWVCVCVYIDYIHNVRTCSKSYAPKNQLAGKKKSARLPFLPCHPSHCTVMVLWRTVTWYKVLMHMKSAAIFDTTRRISTPHAHPCARPIN